MTLMSPLFGPDASSGESRAWSILVRLVLSVVLSFIATGESIARAVPISAQGLISFAIKACHDSGASSTRLLYADPLYVSARLYNPRPFRLAASLDDDDAGARHAIAQVCSNTQVVWSYGNEVLCNGIEVFC